MPADLACLCSRWLFPGPISAGFPPCELIAVRARLPVLASGSFPVAAALQASHTTPPCGEQCKLFCGRFLPQSASSVSQPLSRVASRTPARPVCHVVPLASLADRHDVVSVCVTLPHADAPAVSARPGVPRQHSQTPGLVSGVTVSSLVGVWPCLAPSHANTGRNVSWYSLWHSFAAMRECSVDFRVRDTKSVAAVITR